MDREKRNRSFQNINQTYEQIVEQVVSAYAGGFAICTIGYDLPIGKPLIQYGETDWEFLRRIASQLGGVVVPEVSRGLPRIWFGFPDRSYKCSFPEHCYTSGLSQHFFENGGEAAGLRREDYFYYDVESPQNCDIGWYTYFKGQMFLIANKRAKMTKGEFLFTYRLGRSGFGYSAPQFNDKIGGMSLLGEVVSTAAETVSLRLDIDQGHEPGGTYPYPWRPATGNLMYCMPQIGTRVSLYFPTLDERDAQVVNCVRTNGENCERMSDPSKRAFVTEHGKELTLYLEEMSLKGGIGQLMMSDADGIKLSSDGIIQIIGADVRFEAPTVTCTAPKGELIMAKTDATLQEPESSFSMSNTYQVLSQSDTVVEGADLETFEPYADQPEEGSFDWGTFGGHLLAGLVAIVVAVAVVALVATGVGAIAVAAGAAAATVSAVSSAAIGGCIAVGVTQVASQAITAGWDNTDATLADTFCLGLRAGVAGAVAGAVGAFLPGGAILAVGAGGVIEGTIERAILGENTTFWDVLLDFGISAATFGILDGVVRKLKRIFGKVAKETTEEVSEKAAKEAVPPISKDATGIADIGGARYRVGNVVDPIEKTLDHCLNPEGYIQEVIEKYGINLRGSGQKITIKYDPDHIKGPGYVSKLHPNTIILGPEALRSEVELANTIAHELNHWRDWLKGGVAPEPPAYNAGNSLADYINGGR